MILPLSYFSSIVMYVLMFLISAYILNSKLKNIFFKIALASLLPFLISGFRYNVGWDYGSYAWGFELFDPTISLFNMITEYEIGDSIGLDLVLFITKSLNSQFLYFAITSALCFVPAFLYLFNEWNDEKNILPLAIFATGFTLFFTGLSAIKQGIAISFCLYSLTYVCKRKPLKFLLFVGIAFLFHSSALVFLPVYLCWGHKATIEGWKKVCIVGLALLFVIFLGEILSTFGGERFAAYGAETLATNNYSFYLMLFWLIVFFVFRSKLVAIDERNELLIILYAVAVILMILGFRNAFTKRIANFFDVVQIMLLPQLVFVFTKRSRIIATILIGIYFVLYCMMLNSGTAENMAPIPYSFLFGE
ncbi:EpsG family protein [uncultured Flavonifractor sp.]|uniref:EpsG family protein n=1 Tax=uncultured Flavonifractor sp. TaxID=1193534 RepID=UPI002607E604|nr:EpsG family protein [uncultured Flavonifractor sp.]